MHYFEFYSLGISFKVDEKLLKQKYLENSKKYHPDFFALESEAKQMEVLGLSTLNNQAFKVLSQPDLRCKYVLESLNLLEEGEKYVLPPDFLMEMMEVNERLMELEMEEDKGKVEELENSISGIFSDLNSNLALYFDQFESAEANEREGISNKIKDLYFRKKYLLRIQESLLKIASQFN